MAVKSPPLPLSISEGRPKDGWTPPAFLVAVATDTVTGTCPSSDELILSADTPSSSEINSTASSPATMFAVRAALKV